MKVELYQKHQNRICSLSPDMSNTPHPSQWVLHQLSARTQVLTEVIYVPNVEMNSVGNVRFVHAHVSWTDNRILQIALRGNQLSRENACVKIPVQFRIFFAVNNRIFKTLSLKEFLFLKCSELASEKGIERVLVIVPKLLSIKNKMTFL